MIIGNFWQGSGIGNQLARYLFVRCKAKDLGVPFGMIGDFKGKEFMPIDMGEPVPDLAQFKHFIEERINTPDGVDIRPYDPKTELIEDNTVVEGEFQDPKYFEHHLDEIREWLKVEEKPLQMTFVKLEDICVLNVRGGEYRGVPDLFLPKEYWYYAMEKMKVINPKMRFSIITDDVALCQEWFPNFYIRHDEYDWHAVRYAQYLILSNSSFAIVPALLGNAKKIFAPKWWAGYNVGYWKMPQNQYKQFEYIHHNESNL